RTGALGGALSLLAYGIVIWAMTQAPIGLVAALRESSVLFAVLLSWCWLGEKLGRQDLSLLHNSLPPRHFQRSRPPASSSKKKMLPSASTQTPT
ncbi:hypothetical protein ACQ4LF_23905, partial [Aeromonas salmonicida]